VTEGRIVWTRVAKGLYFIGFGGVLFLNTQGIVPWSVWRGALAYWPVLLVAIGLRLIFERTATPVLVLLGPVLVLGTLGWVALQDRARPPAEWEEVRAERIAGLERWTFRGRLAMIDLDLAARDLGDALLARGRVSPAGRRELRVTVRDDAAQVSLRGPRGAWRIGLLPPRLNGVELEVARDLPLRIDLDLALAEGRLELSEATVTRVALGGALNELTLRLGAPRSDVRIDLDGALNRIVLEVPPGTPVTTSTDGFLNAVDGRPGAGSLSGPGYHVEIDGAFNHLVVSSD
jgi:hypothetical protein